MGRESGLYYNEVKIQLKNIRKMRQRIGVGGKMAEFWRKNRDKESGKIGSFLRIDARERWFLDCMDRGNLIKI